MSSRYPAFRIGLLRRLRLQEQHTPFAISENHIRYACRIEADGTWTVFDTSSGEPADVSACLTVGMQMSDAEEIMDVLNLLHPAQDAGTLH